MYLLSVTIHVLSAVAAFGAVFALPVVRRGAADVPTAVQTELNLVRRVVTPAMTGSLLTGLYQVATGPFGFGQVWVTATLALLFGQFAIAGSGVTRDAKRALSAFEAGRTEEAHAAWFRLTGWWVIIGFLAVLAIGFMVTKPAFGS